MGGVSRTGANGLTRRGEQAFPHGHVPGTTRPAGHGDRSPIGQPSLVSRPPTARPARSAAVSPHRCAAILSTLKEISTATPDVEGCRRLLECISNELQAEQGVLILCNSLTRELEFVVHNQDPATTGPSTRPGWASTSRATSWLRWQPGRSPCRRLSAPRST
jgi:hypothetical protein